MAGITLEQAQAQLDAWMAANLAVSSGQSYTIGTRQLTRVDAKDILEQIEFWEARVDALSRGTRGMRVRGATPV